MRLAGHTPGPRARRPRSRAMPKIKSAGGGPAARKKRKKAKSTPCHDAASLLLDASAEANSSDDDGVDAELASAITEEMNKATLAKLEL